MRAFLIRSLTRSNSNMIFLRAVRLPERTKALPIFNELANEFFLEKRKAAVHKRGF